MVVLSAEELAPAAYEVDHVEKVKQEDLMFDIRNLMVLDPHAVDQEQMEQLGEDTYIQQSSQKSLQALVSCLFNLPSTPSETGPSAILPTNDVIVLPREKPIPKPKEETRWEKFAKAKGVAVSRKRERMVWDEATNEWKPRYGYKRANNGILDHAIVEVKPGADPNADVWAEARTKKKMRVMKNEISQTKNRERAAGRGGGIGGGGMPSAGIPLELIAEGGNKKRGKVNTKAALAMAQTSTASMGKFDKQREGEPEKRDKGKRRKFAPVVPQQSHGERDMSLKVLKSVMVNKTKGKETAQREKRDFTAYDAVEGEADGGMKRKKGRGATGKFKKITRARTKK